jgi:hypothetical protein
MLTTILTIVAVASGPLAALAWWYGWRARRKIHRYTHGQCQFCGGPRAYNREFDAYWCEICMRWQEPRCGDKDCLYCTDRPRRPTKEGRG